jgi:hypothetical protein
MAKKEPVEIEGQRETKEQVSFGGQVWPMSHKVAHAPFTAQQYFLPRLG